MKVPGVVAIGVTRASAYRRFGAACLVLLGGCAQLITPALPPAGAGGPYTSIQPFSLTATGSPTPPGWEPWIISRFMARTKYAIVDHEGERVLAARAEVSASGLLQPLHVTAGEYPVLSWRWKVPQLIEEADNASRVGDDSPVRVIVAFDGDRSRLDVGDRAFADTVKFFSGREMPYASIQYIWENRLPRETVLDNAHTARSKMVVVESGPARLGKWLAFKRNIKADYERLFGESPGAIIYVGVMTDTSATASRITAYYGDIRLSREE